MKSNPLSRATPPPSREILNRRCFIRNAAVGGAAAWTVLPHLAIAAEGEQLISAKKSSGQSTISATDKSATPLAPPDKQPASLKLPEPVNKKAGWAIVGLGELALGECMPAFRVCQNSQPVALVSGHPEKAKQVAAAYGMDPKHIYNYENFDTLIDTPEVDIVYIVLPNSMHAEFTIRALKAGKHVLCEKPMAASVEESERMIAAARQAGKKLSIAYRLHYEPMNRMAMKLAKEETLGKIKTFSASNCQDVKAPNIRLSAETAGGPVGDVGVYCINAARYVIGEEPVEVTAIAHQPKDDPRFREVPESVVFTLRYPSGVLAHCDCSFGSGESRRFRVHCEKGFIELDPAFSYHGLKMRVKRTKGELGGPEVTELGIEEINQFAAQFDHFSQCVLDGLETRTPAEMGLADMKIMAAIQKSIESKGSVISV